MAEAVVFLAFAAFSVEISTVTASVILFVATLALNVGLSLLLKPKARRDQSPDNSRNFTYERAPRTYVTGRAIVAGPILFREAIKSPSVLYQITAHCDGPIAAIERILLDDVDVRLGVTARNNIYTTANPWEPPDSVYTPSRLNPIALNRAIKIRTFLGTQTQGADAGLISKFPGQWTSAHQGKGICYTSAEFSALNSSYFPQIYRGGSPPAIRLCVRSDAVFNVRGNADPADLFTWSESSNAADAICSLLLRKRRDGGIGVNPDLVDISGTFAAFAAIADTIITGADGVERKLWCIDGSWSSVDDPRDVLDRMQRSCGAQIFETSQGKIGIRGGRWQEPEVHFTDDDLVAVEMERGPDTFTAVTTIKPNWNSLDHKGPRIEATAVKRQDLIDRAGGEEITEPYDADMCVNHNQSRHLASIELQRRNAEWRGKVTTTLRGISAWDDANVTLSIRALDIIAQPFRIIDRELQGDLIEWTVESTKPSDWDLPEDAAPPELPPTSDAKPGAPVILQPEFIAMRTGPDGTGTCYIDIYSDLPHRPECMVLIEYWKNGTATVTETVTSAGKLADVAGTVFSVILPPGEAFHRISGIPVGEVWKAWSRTYTPDGYESEWTSAYVQSSDATTPAQVTASLTATALSTPNGSISHTTTALPATSPELHVEVRAPDDWNVVAVEFYYTVNSAVFATTNPIGASMAVMPDVYCHVTAPNFMVTGNTYRFWARFQRADLTYTTPVVSANVAV